MRETNDRDREILLREIEQLRDDNASLRAQLQGAITQRQAAEIRLHASQRHVVSLSDRLWRAVNLLLWYAADEHYDDQDAPGEITPDGWESDRGARAHDLLCDLGIDPPTPLEEVRQ